MDKENKTELMSMGSNQINVNGEVVSRTYWEGYSPDGEHINLNFFKDGKNAKIRNLNLQDFGNILRNPISNDYDEFEEIKRKLDPSHYEFQSILSNCKNKKTTSKTLKKKPNKNANKKSKKRRGKKEKK